MNAHNTWSRDRLDALVEATSQIVWHADALCQVKGCLPAWQRYTGQSKKQIQGNGWAEAVHPDDRPHCLASLNEALANRSIYDYECRILRRDGCYRYFVVRGAPVLREDGSIREWVGTCMDISEHKHSEIEHNRFFSLSLDLLCIAGTEGYFHRLNPAFETTLGYTQQELLGRPFIEFVHPDDRAVTLQAAQKLKDGAVLVNFENRYRRKDGSYCWLLWSSTPYAEEGLIYAAARDITDRKLAEEKVRKLNDKLDARVARRTAQLEAANRELESFSYSVSHNLREPIRGIDSFTRILLEEYGKTLDAEGNRLLGIIAGEASRLGELIDDLLDFMKMARKPLKESMVDMSELAQNVFDRLDSAEREKISRFLLHPLPRVRCDRAMMYRVMHNLISNAAKFSRHSDNPCIEVGYLPGDTSHGFYVKDNGAGFEQRFVGKLFKVFQRLHRQDQFEGTGIGLAIAQQVVNRHGGEIWAEGEIGKGAQIHFSLPKQQENSHELK